MHSYVSLNLQNVLATQTYVVTCLLVTLILMFAGCATPESRVINNQEIKGQIAFIKDGISTRSEIIKRLGVPGAEYEDGRIIIYWVMVNKVGEYDVVPRKETPLHNSRPPAGSYGRSSMVVQGIYNLVLVFRSDDILERHRLVFKR